MIERRIAKELTGLLNGMPSVALLGPRQVGKTTLALAIAEQRPSVYLDLESDADRARLAEPELYLMDHQEKLSSWTRSTGCRTYSETCAD